MRQILTVGVCVLAGVVSVSAGQQISAEPQTPGSGGVNCQEPLPDLYKRVAPSIVLIEATSIDQYDPQHRMERVSGSGVIVDPRGLILTNSHVVFNRTVMTVTLDDGTMVPAEPAGADPLYDIALIRIAPPRTGKLQAADLGDSDSAQVGDEVYAIGNPLGLNRTLTRGVVSAVNRLLPTTAWSINEPLIQTDAAINPGNSGGPLYNRCGQVIGITTAILPDAQSIGFAIPSNLIKSVIPPLLADGRLIRPWLGVQGQFVPPALKHLLRIPLADGFLVEAVEPGSPAEKAGVHDGEFELTLGGEPILLGGDIITEVNGSKLDAMDKLETALSSLKIGGSLKVTVFRDNKTLHLEIGIVERPIMPWDLPGRQADVSTLTAGRESPLRLWPGSVVRRRISF